MNTNLEIALSVYLEKFNNANESLNFVFRVIGEDGFRAGYNAVNLEYALLNYLEKFNVDEAALNSATKAIAEDAFRAGWLAREQRDGE